MINRAIGKNILLHYLEPVGGKLILCCDFDLKKLPVKLPAFYEECFKSFAKCSAANHTSVQDQIRQDLSKAIVWNNKFICIGGKSVYFRNLAEKGILRMGDLISDNNEFIVKSNYKLRELNISPLDIFRLISVIDALPAEWRESLNTLASTADKPFNFHNEIKLSVNDKNVLIETVVSKTVYKELRNKIVTPPTAQLNFNTLFVNDVLEWKEIYSLPFRTSLDTKSREFQYKLLNRCLVTNSFLNKIGIIPSPACSFCGEMNESLEHFFICCRYTKDFWAEVIKWFDNQGVKIEHLSDKDIMFGILRCEDELFINHTLITAKQYLYSCRQNNSLPSIKVFNSKMKMIHQLETMIAKSNNKLKAHNMKWGKYKNN